MQAKWGFQFWGRRVRGENMHWGHTRQHESKVVFKEECWVPMFAWKTVSKDRRSVWREKRRKLWSAWMPPTVSGSSVQSLSRVRLWDPMDCSMPGLPVHHQLPEFTQTHAHRVSDAIQPSHPLSSPSPPGFSLSQHQGLFQQVSSSQQVVKVLEFQLQHQSFHWIFRTDFL